MHGRSDATYVLALERGACIYGVYEGVYSYHYRSYCRPVVSGEEKIEIKKSRKKKPGGANYYYY